MAMDTPCPALISPFGSCRGAPTQPPNRVEISPQRLKGLGMLGEHPWVLAQGLGTQLTAWVTSSGQSIGVSHGGDG